MGSILRDHRVLYFDSVSPVGPHLFDLNTKSPISITDQMGRGYQLIREAIDEKLIGPDKPLLVVGAGIAGLMAAMTAVKIGSVPTRVIEKDRPLSTQVSCPSRYVCPTQYEWPSAHWQKGIYPFDGTSMPFNWVRGYSGVVADALVKEHVAEFLHENNRWIKIIRSEFLGYNITPHTPYDWWVIPKLSDPPDDIDFPDAFSMVVSCAGFGTENTTAHRIETCFSDPEAREDGPEYKPYTGYKFWEADKYEQEAPPLGIEGAQIPKVLISGGGDGAIQDFLRIITRMNSTSGKGLSPGDLYSRIMERVSNVTRSKIESVLANVEMTFRKDLIAVQEFTPDNRKHARCSINGNAHSEHLKIIAELSGDQKAWARIATLLTSLTKKLDREITVNIVYPCFHLSPFYGLNRFLVLLIAEYLNQQYPSIQVFHPNTMITNIIGTPEPYHICGYPEICHGQDHQVFCSVANCITVDTDCVVREQKLENSPYNVIIIRHGIERGSRKELLNRASL